MSLIEKLDEAMRLLHDTEADWGEFYGAAIDLFRDHGPAIRQAMIDTERYRALAVMEDQPWVTFKFQADGMTAYGPVLPINRKPWLDAAIDAARATGEGEGNG